MAKQYKARVEIEHATPDEKVLFEVGDVVPNNIVEKNFKSKIKDGSIGNFFEVTDDAPVKNSKADEEESEDDLEGDTNTEAKVVKKGKAAKVTTTTEATNGK